MKYIIEPEEYFSVLEKYKGANAQFWLFHVSHKRFVLRLSWPNVTKELKEVVYIAAASCEFIEGAFSWRNANISISNYFDNERKEKMTELIDIQAGFKLSSSGGIALLRGPETDIDKSLERFFE